MIFENFDFRNNINLENVSYKENIVEESPEEIKISDTIGFSYKDNEGFLVNITRNVWFEPSSIFDIEIEASTFLDEKADSTYDKKELTVEEFIEEFEPVISAVCSKISSVISMITLASSNAPLITPPQIVAEEQS